MLKEYLQLVRIPGIFTAFSNVLVGYFFTSELASLPFLLLTSGMLFCSGMILNDYFDLKIDKKERPTRPIPSGKISKQHALLLGIIFLVIANSSAFFVGYNALFVSLLMTSLIISYNFKLKFISFFGIFTLSSIRFLNVMLGFSVIGISFEMLQYAIPVGIFVGGISILAKNELRENVSAFRNLNTILILITIGFTVILIIDNFHIESLIFLGLFSIISLYALLQKQIKQKITLQLISIILLDAVVISIFSSIHASLFVALLIIPPYFISKKLYMT